MFLRLAESYEELREGPTRTPVGLFRKATMRLSFGFACSMGTKIGTRVPGKQSHSRYTNDLCLARPRDQHGDGKTTPEPMQ